MNLFPLIEEKEDWNPLDDILSEKEHELPIYNMNYPSDYNYNYLCEIPRIDNETIYN